ncbi:MAG: type ISP restriction/modification enzyme [Salinibacter sp.]
MRQQRRAFQDVIERYLGQLSDLSQDEDASNELSLRPALDTFIEGLSSAFDRDDMSVITEPIRQTYGTPDYKLKTDKGFLIGYIEAKGLTKDLDDLPDRDAEQVERYRDAGKRFILTNHRDFWLYDYASDGRTVMLRDQITLLSKSDVEQGRRPKEADVDALHRLLDRFLRDARPDINTPEQLAERLAAAARHLCDELRKAYDAEGESGQLHGLKQAFEEILIPDIDRDQFTDMYAQTLAYGLFAAAVNHEGPELLNLDNAWRDIPKTNKFLRRLFESVTGSALEDKSYKWIIEDLLDLFNNLNMTAILEGFGRRPAGQDPVVHFYEDFLAAYDPELRERRGVYYTPEPVVSYIVRSVDYLLKERFHCPDGLADRQQISHSLQNNGERENKYENSHKVLVLDPACGTGTFLYFVIDLIRQRFRERDEGGMWAEYVRKHLLPRIFGFELLMASYAMAHLKLGLQLSAVDLPKEMREEWEYSFDTDERLGIYLTNTLEEPRPREVPLYGPLRVITEEANMAAQVKHDLPILTIIGNPPYANFGRMNQGDWIQGLMKDWKPIDERKWNPDDFMKFIRWAQWRIDRTGAGILAFITNHSYIEGLTHRTMRKSLASTFTDLYILDLHGSSIKSENSPPGTKDENVFDIQPGVAIGIFVKDPDRDAESEIHFHELWGPYSEKYSYLSQNDLSTTSWTKIMKVDADSYFGQFCFFKPIETEVETNYHGLWNVGQLFIQGSSAVQTKRDQLFVDMSDAELQRRMEEVIDNWPQQGLNEEYPLQTTSGWSPNCLEDADYDEANVERYLYRPFDLRYIYYDSQLLGRARLPVMQHLRSPNLALAALRQTVDDEFRHVFVSNQLCDINLLIGHHVSDRVFPLYIYPSSDGKDTISRKQMISILQQNLEESTSAKFLVQEREKIEDLIERFFPNETYARWPNLDPYFVLDVCNDLHLDFVSDGLGDLQNTFGPEDVFHYIYAILHAPTYRERYQEFLKIDFPRVPLTSNLDLFRALCQNGADLVALHLVEADYAAASWNQEDDIANPFQNAQVRYPVRGENIVEKGHPKYAAPGTKVKGEDDPIPEGRVYISESKPTKGKQGQYFEGVPPEVWKFQVGGYQVCEKWLKDRKGRKLSYDDREHYKRIVVALGETIRLMSEIDEVIDEHGGWPIE